MVIKYKYKNSHCLNAGKENFLYLESLLKTTYSEALSDSTQLSNQENKWQALADECRARRNYAKHHKVPYSTVTIAQISEHELGVAGWAEVGSTRDEDDVNEAPKAKAKPKAAKAKAKPKAASASFAKKEAAAKSVVAQWQSAVGSIKGVVKLVSEDPPAWIWAEALLNKFSDLEKKVIENTSAEFVETFKAACFDANAMRNLRKTEAVFEKKLEAIADEKDRVDQMVKTVGQIKAMQQAFDKASDVTPAKKPRKKLLDCNICL